MFSFLLLSFCNLNFNLDLSALWTWSFPCCHSASPLWQTFWKDTKFMEAVGWIQEEAMMAGFLPCLSLWLVQTAVEFCLQTCSDNLLYDLVCFKHTEPLRKINNLPLLWRQLNPRCKGFHLSAACVLHLQRNTSRGYPVEPATCRNIVIQKNTLFSNLKTSSFSASFDPYLFTY